MFCEPAILLHGSTIILPFLPSCERILVSDVILPRSLEILESKMVGAPIVLGGQFSSTCADSIWGLEFGHVPTRADRGETI